ncbi:MAG TPA: amidase [Candidatus Limnocylindria bacterium]|jgi:Asp-tRNA(Asn)/Glu-tRNA(Gln) amidotransferase A subunit family amidase|nr:amidase [Candidatus Limnocylindria bacterium]
MSREKITSLPLKELHRRLRDGELSAGDLTEAALAAVAEFPATPMLLSRDDDTARQKARLSDGQRAFAKPLAGLPVSVKDLFDLAGMPSTCGSPFYASTRPVPEADSGYVARWRSTGVNFLGKTHLNEFAYGITGENRWFGNCLMPGFPDRLTGGSSSGAAATVLAGAACLALGTDTGGSLRVPAALCGLVSFRQSLGFAEWENSFPLAHSFDTAGWLQRHLGDVAFVAQALHPEMAAQPRREAPRVRLLDGPWLAACEPEVFEAFDDFGSALAETGCSVARHVATGLEAARDLFVPIQAHEASGIHARFLPQHADQYDPAILERLKMGAGVTVERYAELQTSRSQFVAERIAPLFLDADFLVAPASATPKLLASADQSATRPRLLTLTTLASLAGLPVLTIPWMPQGLPGFGFQVMAPRGSDAHLWAFADWLSERRFSTGR